MTGGGSTDVAGIGWNTPTALFGRPTMPLGLGLHTWPATACGGMSIGAKGSLAARVLAATGFDLMTDVALRAAAGTDSGEGRAGGAYASPLPPDRKQPPNAPGGRANRGQEQVLGDLDE